MKEDLKIKEISLIEDSFKKCNKGCPKINARFEFAAIFASSRWQA